jgi:hypothetical protein
LNLPRQVDDLRDVSCLEQHIAESAVVPIFLSASDTNNGGYLHSKNCLRELKTARVLRKPLILVYEPEFLHGGGGKMRNWFHNIEQSQKDECMAWMAESNRSTKSMAALSHLDVEYLRQEYEKHAIPWYRNQHQQLVSLKHIAIMLCAHSQHFRKSNKHVSPFKIKDELPVKSLRFLEPQKLFICAGDSDLAAAIRMELSHQLTWPNCNLTWIDVADQMDASTTLLVYLHRHIWAEPLEQQHDSDDATPIRLLRRVLLQQEEDDALTATPWKAFIDQERIFEAQQLLAKTLAKGHEREGSTPLRAQFRAEMNRQRLSEIHTAASAISGSSDLEEYTSRRLRVRKVRGM